MKRFCLLLAVWLMLWPSAQAKSQPLFEPVMEKIYNYCPAVFMEDGVTHVYYCTNTANGTVRDSIGYRYSLDGVHYSEETIVLRHSPSNTQWDGEHTCDPDIVKGEFYWNGEVYHYLLAYLGCRTQNNQQNEIGLAVAKEPGGPFIKLDHLNPFVPYEYDDSSEWARNAKQGGTGWASLISLDRRGQIMMLYTRSDAVGYELLCEKWDLSDLNAPQPICGDQWRIKVPHNGVVGRDMRPFIPAGVDAVYDSKNGQIYMAFDGAPQVVAGVDDPGEPTFVSSTAMVVRYSQTLFPGEIADFFVNATGEKWSRVAQIGKKETDYPRNHNVALLSDPYGWKLDEGALQLFYTVSEVGMPHDSLWTYRIHQYTIPLEE